MGQLVKYGSYSTDAAAEAKKTIESAGSGDFIKIKEGRTKMRILPPPAGKKSPFVEVWKHYVRFGSGKDSQLIVMVCPRMTDKAGEHCVICDEVKELRSSGKPSDRNKGYDMRAQLKAMANIIDRKNPDKGIQVWELTQGQYDDLNDIRLDPDDPCDFTDPIKGYDIHVDREGTSKEDTKYTVDIARRASPLATDDNDDEGLDYDLMNEWIEDQSDLVSFKSLPSDKDLRLALEGERADDGEDNGRGRKRMRSGGGDGDGDGDGDGGGRGSRRSRRRERRDEGDGDGGDDKVIDAEFEEGEDGGVPEGA